MGLASCGMPLAWARMGTLPSSEEPEEPSGLGAEQDRPALPSAGCAAPDSRDVG